MKIEDDEFGGRTAWVGPADDLDDVPKPFAGLLTPAVREVFADPRAYFRVVADRCPFPNMAKWLKTVTHARRGYWILVLEQGEPKKHKRAGFYLGSKAVSGAIIGPPAARKTGRYPKGLADFYALIGFADWTGLMLSGKLYRPGDHPSMAGFGYTYHGDPIDPAQTFMVGDSLCGDFMVYTQDDRAGWINHGDGHVHLLGTTADLVNWVFGELLADRIPEYDHAWAK